MKNLRRTRIVLNERIIRIRVTSRAMKSSYMGTFSDGNRFLFSVISYRGTEIFKDYQILRRCTLKNVILVGSFFQYSDSKTLKWKNLIHFHITLEKRPGPDEFLRSYYEIVFSVHYFSYFIKLFQFFY